MSKAIKTIKYGSIYGLILLAILALSAFAIMAKEASAQMVDYNTGYQNRLAPEDSNNTSVNPIPAVDSISPSSGNLGSGPTTVTITGSGFVPNSVARWNGSDKPTAFIDYSHLLIYLNSGDMYGSAGRYITVWNPAPSGGYSNAAFFTINGYIAQKNTIQPGTAVQNRNTSNGNNSNSNTNNNTTGSVEGAQTTNDGSASNNYNAFASNVLYGSNSFMPSGLVQWLLFAIFILIVVIVIRKIFFEDKYSSKPLKHA